MNRRIKQDITLSQKFSFRTVECICLFLLANVISNHFTITHAIHTADTCVRVAYVFRKQCTHNKHQHTDSFNHINHCRVAEAHSVILERSSSADIKLRWLKLKRIAFFFLKTILIEIYCIVLFVKRNVLRKKTINFL